MPRRKDEPGKGGFWRINPEYENMFINGIFKKRRASNSPVTTLAPLAKRLRSDGFDEDDDSDSCSLPSTPVDNSPMLNSTSPLLMNVTHRQHHHHHKTTPVTSQSGVDVKQEPREFSAQNLNNRLLSNSVASAHAHTTSSGGGGDEPTLDFNWNSILLQDIDVGGTKVKTEDIIDHPEHDDIASPIISLSPPPSDSNSDISIDDLLNNATFAANEFENPIDFESGQPLDLSISGMSLRPPDWWSDSINESKGFLSPSHAGNGLDTPVTSQSPMGVTDSSGGGLADHPWAESRDVIDNAISSFDTDITNLFDIDNIPSPGLDDAL